MNTAIHPFLRLLLSQDPKTFSVHLDGVEIYRGEFTDSGIKTLIDQPIDINRPRYLLNIFFDSNPMPIYALSLGGETG
jgi:hypothetical protein